jgi:GTP pyrophosphokinase/guanosine-3',5'-bis(diphosphate) 3'-pyrophosphohydrolase
MRATIRNTPGVLGEVCTIIGEARGNIVGLKMHYRQEDYFDVDIDLDVKDNRHLTNLVAALRACPSVENADRALG